MRKDERDFLTNRPVAHLATADNDGVPHVVPVCFALTKNTIFTTIDRKPKRGSADHLKRLQNIAVNPNVAFVADHYEDDWGKIGWVLVRGQARILKSGREYFCGQQALRKQYSQYKDMDLTDLPLISIEIEVVKSWGNLS